MTTTITFSRQNEGALRTRTSYYWENLVLVVVFFSKSKAQTMTFLEEGEGVNKVYSGHYESSDLVSVVLCCWTDEGSFEDEDEAR